MCAFIGKFLGIFHLLLTPHAQGQVSIEGKHVYIVQKGVDSILGSYMFVVKNESKEIVKASMPLTLPDETIDFSGHSGVGANELQPGGDGGVVLTKEFKPGDNLTSIGFMVPAKQGQANITFSAKSPMSQLVVFTRHQALAMKGEGFEFKENTKFANAFYDTLTKENIKTGEKAVVTIQGAVEGRTRVALVGYGALIALLFLGGFFTWKTKPSPKQSQTIEI